MPGVSEEEVRHAERAAELTAERGAVVVVVIQDDTKACGRIERDVRNDEGANLRGAFEMDRVGRDAAIRAVAVRVVRGVNEADAWAKGEISRLTAVQRKEEAACDGDFRVIVLKGAAQ